MGRIGDIKKNVKIAPQVNDVLEKQEKKCKKIKFPDVVDSDDEEEMKVWAPLSCEIKGVKSTIDSINDASKDWSNSKDGKMSHENFKIWLDMIMGKMNQKQKKIDDEEIFN